MELVIGSKVKTVKGEVFEVVDFTSLNSILIANKFGEVDFVPISFLSECDDFSSMLSSLVEDSTSSKSLSYSFEVDGRMWAARIVGSDIIIFGNNTTMKVNKHYFDNFLYNDFRVRQPSIAKRNMYEGEEMLNSKSQHMVLTKYVNSREVYVMFDDGDLVKTTYKRFKRGWVHRSDDTAAISHYEVVEARKLEKMIEKYVGKRVRLSNGRYITIVDYVGNGAVNIRYDDDGSMYYEVPTQRINKSDAVSTNGIGFVRNICHHLVLSVINIFLPQSLVDYSHSGGVLVEGLKGKQVISYDVFISMLLSSCKPVILDNGKSYLPETKEASFGLNMHISDVDCNGVVLGAFDDGIEFKCGVDDFYQGVVKHPNFGYVLGKDYKGFKYIYKCGYQNAQPMFKGIMSDGSIRLVSYDELMSM